MFALFLKFLDARPFPTAFRVYEMPTVHYRYREFHMMDEPLGGIRTFSSIAPHR